MCDQRPRRTGRHWASAFVIVATVAALGCGGAHQGTLTKAQFVAKADAVCQVAGQKLAYVRHKFAPVAHGVIVRELIRKEVAVRQTATSKLESLPRPAREDPRIEAWLTARTVAGTMASDVAEAPGQGYATAIRDLQTQLQIATARARGLAQDYGLRVCRATE